MPYRLVLLFLLVSPFSWADVAIVDENCNNKYAAKVLSLQGTFWVDPERKGAWHPARLNELVCEGSGIKVEANSRASLRLVSGVVLRLHEGTNATLDAISTDKPTFIHLFNGFIHFISRTPRLMKISTPIANGGPEGTEFAMSVDDNKASLWVYEGGVKFYNDKGSVFLKPGEGGQTLKGQAPQAKIDIKPQDAVTWALYYPPVLPYPAANTGIDGELRTAINDYRQGHTDTALARLDSLPTTQQTSYFYQARAAMRLTVGQDQLALQDIQRLRNNNPQDADALALQSILALTQNRKDEAYALATQAIAANPQAASAYSALSYAEQSRFQLDKAQVAANKATELAPHDAMVWARKAELQLSQGLTAESQQAAEKAIALDANLERTQTVLGFSYLLRMDADAAKETFNKAIQFDSTAPLARLGLGLAKIRKGDLQQGREDLETAAILDPNNSIVRSYLGKAYYEERRSPLAEDQFKLAKERDPKDPTPYFYGALEKQTANKPVEALRDLQKSFELNDNRAVFRSRQSLDQDRSIRGTSIARIFNTLGLERRAIVNASQSLSLDPSDASSHRFLSDIYTYNPRQKIAQVSELLQAQLLQPININPVQPRLSVTGLGSISGVSFSEMGFKDFTSVFDRDRPQLTTSGVIGNNNTYSDEAVLSGIYKKLSFSFGQFHYETDGFRPDAEMYQDIYDVYLQVALTDKLNFQFEYRNQAINQGNQTLSFDEVPASQEKLNHETIRGGLHWAINTQNDILASLIYSERKEDVLTNFPTQLNSTTDSRNGFTGELQYIGRNSIGNLVLGGGSYSFDGPYAVNSTNTDNSLCSIFPELCLPNIRDYNQGYKGNNVYIYTNIKATDYLTATLGLSYDYFEQSQPYATVNKINPKFGFQWDISEHFKLRTAYYQTVKRLLAADQTIEPTQIAGFNQFYDDFNGTRAALFGIALDGRATNNLYGGFEFIHRKLIQLDAPVEDIAKTYDHKEERFRGYLFWSPISQLALNIEFQHETQLGDLLKLTTDTLPFSIKYFHPSGVFSEIKSTYVWQREFTSNNNRDDFLVVDGTIGYRLPRRWGILSLEARNIFNRHFQFQDLSRISSDSFSIQRSFLPDRTLFARITLNF